MRRNHDICLLVPVRDERHRREFEALLRAGVDVACMDVRCFEEESSNTIIYCFCAGIETVKNAVVNLEVEVKHLV